MSWYLSSGLITRFLEEVEWIAEKRRFHRDEGSAALHAENMIGYEITSIA
jgi:hypothetical protein